MLEEAWIIGQNSNKRLPGILSALSPESATTSTNCEGFSAPYRLTKSSTPNETILHVQIIKLNYFKHSVKYLQTILTYPDPRGAILSRRKEGDKIWKKSLSGETIRTFRRGILRPKGTRHK